MTLSSRLSPEFQSGLFREDRSGLQFRRTGYFRIKIQNVVLPETETGPVQDVGGEAYRRTGHVPARSRHECRCVPPSDPSSSPNKRCVAGLLLGAIYVVSSGGPSNLISNL